MYNGIILSSQEMVDKLLFDPSEFSYDVGSATPNIQRALYEYYRKNDEFGVYSFDFINADDEIEHTAHSISGRPLQSLPSIESVSLSESFVSEYNTRLLEQLGVDSNETWNGDIAVIQYNDGNIVAAESDYYSIQTIEKLLDAEAMYALSLVDSAAELAESHFPLRSELLKTESDFSVPKRPIGSSAAALVIMNTGNSWKMLLSRRADTVSTNPNMISILPSGFVEYTDLWGGTFETVPIREGAEELFAGNELNGRTFFSKYVHTYPTEFLWRLKSGGLVGGSLFVVEDPAGYEFYQKHKNVADEAFGVHEVDIFDVEAISQVFTLSKMSGNILGIACLGLEKFDDLNQYPDLPYSIRPRLE